MGKLKFLKILKFLELISKITIHIFENQSSKKYKITSFFGKLTFLKILKFLELILKYTVFEWQFDKDELSSGLIFWHVIIFNFKLCCFETVFQVS